MERSQIVKQMIISRSRHDLSPRIGNGSNVIRIIGLLLLLFFVFFILFLFAEKEKQQPRKPSQYNDAACREPCDLKRGQTAACSFACLQPLYLFIEIRLVKARQWQVIVQDLFRFKVKWQ